MHKKVRYILIPSLIAMVIFSGCKKEEPIVETAPPIGFGEQEKKETVVADDKDYDILQETEPQEDLDRVVRETEPEKELASEDADIFNTVAILNYNKTSIPVVYNYDTGLLSGVNIISSVLNFDNNGFNNENIEFELFDTDGKKLVTDSHNFKSEETDEKGNVTATYAKDSYKYINKYLQEVDEYAEYCTNVGDFNININYLAPDGTPLKYTCHVDINTNLNYESLNIPYYEEMPLKFGAKPATMHDYFQTLSEQIADNYREKRGDKGYTEINISKDVKTEQITNEKTGAVTEETTLTPINLEYRVSYPVYKYNYVSDSALNYIYSGEKYSTDSFVVGDLFNRFAYINFLGHNFHLSNILSEQYLGDYGNMITVASKLRDEGFEAYRIEMDALNTHKVEDIADSNAMKSSYDNFMNTLDEHSRYCVKVYFREANSPDYVLAYTIQGTDKRPDSVEVSLLDISNRYTDKEIYTTENATIKLTTDGVAPSKLQLNALKDITLKHSDADKNYKYATSNTFRFFVTYSDSAIKEMSLKRFFSNQGSESAETETISEEIEEVANTNTEIETEAESESESTVESEDLEQESNSQNS